MGESYLSLYHELNAARFDSARTLALIQQLGAPAQVIRGLAQLRRRAWASGAADLRAVVGRSGVASIVEFVAGVGLYVARDYDLALATLARSATHAKPGIAKQARELGSRLATGLGWDEDARAFISLGPGPGPRPSGPEAEPDGDDLVGLAARVQLDLRHSRSDAAAALLARLHPSVRERLPAERAALALIEGDFDEVLVRTIHHDGTPRLRYLRGRALVGLGEFQPAAKLLEQARIVLPRSIPIVLALALAHHRANPESFDEGLERRFEDLLDWAPALLSDAAAELGVELWTDRGPVRERSVIVAILSHAESLLTGDADLQHPSYRCLSRCGQTRLRRIPAAEGPDDSPLTRVHADDRRFIDFVDGTLVRALGIKPPAPKARDRASETSPASAGPWQARSLSPAQIERFLVDGFIVIPRAFDPELARAWREDANRRIRDEPHRWVRGYDPHDEARSLENYSPDDPSTWTWDRLDLDGPETVSIEVFSPKAWAAICDLLGGPDRIKTRTWTNYLIVNFCGHAHLDVPGPAPDWSSWHIDDPSPTTRLDRIHNGLVGITLFDRLLPRSGNTWIAPDSVGRVARELAAHPEGVDFVSNRGSRITTQCERFHEVTGEAGDLLLMHPLMMHSSSPNRSGRIRWMGNPMVYLQEPLRPFRPVAEMSPVELAIHQAIAAGGSPSAQ